MSSFQVYNINVYEQVLHKNVHDFFNAYKTITNGIIVLDI